MREIDKQFHFSVLNGDLPTCKRLVESGADVNAKDDIGWTAFFSAANRNDITMCLALAELGANVDATNTARATPLHIAVEKENNTLCKLILNLGALSSPMDVEGITPLHMAAYSGDREICLELLKFGANPNACRIGGETPLKWSIKGIQYETHQILISHGAAHKPNDTEIFSALLYVAIHNGNIDKCYEALRLVIDPAQIFDLADKAFKHAAFCGQTEICIALLDDETLLLSKTANISDAMLLAASRGNLETCVALLDRGAEVDGVGSDSAQGDRWTALLEAANGGHHDLCLALIQRGADINFSGSGGETPLMLATLIGDAKICQMLLEHGAKLHTPTE